MLKSKVMEQKRTSSIHPVFSNAPLLDGLSLVDLDAVAGMFFPRNIPAGDYFFLQGETADVYYLIGEGRVKVLNNSPEGSQVILHFLGPGDILGALPTLREGAYPASAQAHGDVTAFAMTSERFNDLLIRYPVVTLNLLRFASEKLQATHSRLTELTTERVERRIARTLGRLARQTGKRTDDGIVLGISLTRQDLAEMCGTTIYTISRTLTVWERDGILRSKPEITILRVHDLVGIAEDLPRSEDS
jgi:CRP/FNR family transcriptional regulator, nitrogen oxide reductase regulator